MVYDTKNYWVPGLHLSSRIVNTRKYNISEIGSVPSSDEERETCTLLGLLERASLNH
jgi:hypothetical protein